MVPWFGKQGLLTHKRWLAMFMDTFEGKFVPVLFNKMIIITNLFDIISVHTEIHNFDIFPMFHPRFYWRDEVHRGTPGKDFEIQTHRVCDHY